MANKKHKNKDKKNKKKKRNSCLYESTGKKIKQVDVYRNAEHLLGSSMTEQVAHGKQVSMLAYEVGKELGLDEEALRNLTIAGFFHDIGKTVLELDKQTDRVLLVEEMNSVQKHPEIGYEKLKDHGFSDEICEAVLFHHENYDGSGYPYNVEGWNIPLGACVLRVCDVFCALIQDRPYRKAFSPETAVHIMIEDVKKYDLKVFMALQRVLHRGPGGTIVLPETAPEVEGVWREL
ncbi:MAG: HD domain-containing protein [Eubacteriales bacterium]|nr:HD domain-containing protein [Eubacteriales bacterium]